MIFVNSMSDLFHEDVPDEYIEAAVLVMQRANWHTYQVLTKRSERLRTLLRGKLRSAATAPISGGVSAWRTGESASHASRTFEPAAHASRSCRPNRCCKTSGRSTSRVSAG